MNNIVRYEDFSNQEHLDESASSHELNHFEEACLNEGIDFMDWDDINEDEDLFEAEDKKKGGLLKKIGLGLAKLASGGLKNIAGPILKNLGLPMGGAIAGILDKVSKGLANIKPKEGQKVSAAAVGSPELKQVSDVVKSTLDKVMKEVDAKGPQALFSKANRESVLNLAAVMKSMEAVNAEVAKVAPTAPAKPGAPKPATSAASKAGAAVGKTAGQAIKAAGA